MSFKPYHPKRKPVLSVFGVLLITVGFFMTLSAFAPYPPSGVIAYRWFFGVDAIVIWALVGFFAYRQWQRSRRMSN